MGALGIIGSLLGLSALHVLFKVARFAYRQWASPVRALHGPPNPSLLLGQLHAFDDSSYHKYPTIDEKWITEYGHTITFSLLFSKNQLYTVDPKALNRVLMNYHVWQKPEISRYNLTRIIGGGVLVAEADDHRRQRRIMNPAFGASQIRELTDTFIEKSIQLRDKWASEIRKEGSGGRIEVLSWLSKMTLDVIGLAGFGYTFNALSDKKSALNDAFSAVFESATDVTLILVLRTMFKVLRFIPISKDAKIKESQDTMKLIGRQLIDESKAELKEAKTSSTRRDLLSLLLRANVSVDLPPSQRMSDEEVLSQVPTFLVAGHETTSTATTWTLFALTQLPEAQKKLRDELLAVGTDNPTMDELNALPYLDAVVRESLRVHSPVSATSREAVQDDFVPFSEPLKDRHGNWINGIHVKEGQSIEIPIQALNRLPSIWGEDAAEFKPERWEKIPEGAASIPGVWGNMLTFLGGPRACIGYRFSLVEMKALLFTLIRAFEFELAVPADDITKKSFIVERPLLKSDPKAGNQMPLILKPVVKTD